MILKIPISLFTGKGQWKKKVITPSFFAISTQSKGSSDAVRKAWSLSSSASVHGPWTNCGCRSPSQRIAQSRAVRGKDTTEDTCEDEYEVLYNSERSKSLPSPQRDPNQFPRCSIRKNLENCHPGLRKTGGRWVITTMSLARL